MVHSFDGRVFLGCGLIGGGMVRAALTRGETLRLWNRTRAKADAFAAHEGVTVFEEAAEAVVGARRVHLALTSDDACDAVMDAIRDALDAEAIVVDHSTTSPARTAARATKLTEAGVKYLHAPVFMSPVACENMKGVILVAGQRAHFEAVRAELERMTGSVHYVGEDPGRAAATKLVGNGMILSMVAGLADVFAVGRGHGLRPDDVLGLFEHLDVRNVFKGRGANMAAGEFDALWTLTMARKDLGLMMDAAPREVPMLASIAARADALIDAGFGDHDVGIVAKDSVDSRDTVVDADSPAPTPSTPNPAHPTSGDRR